jgi:hypothetical protein
VDGQARGQETYAKEQKNTKVLKAVAKTIELSGLRYCRGKGGQNVKSIV